MNQFPVTDVNKTNDQQTVSVQTLMILMVLLRSGPAFLSYLSQHTL